MTTKPVSSSFAKPLLALSISLAFFSCGCYTSIVTRSVFKEEAPRDIPERVSRIAFAGADGNKIVIAYASMEYNENSQENNNVEKNFILDVPIEKLKAGRTFRTPREYLRAGSLSHAERDRLKPLRVFESDAGTLDEFKQPGDFRKRGPAELQAYLDSGQNALILHRAAQENDLFQNTVMTYCAEGARYHFFLKPARAERETKMDKEHSPNLILLPFAIIADIITFPIQIIIYFFFEDNIYD